MQDGEGTSHTVWLSQNAALHSIALVHRPYHNKAGSHERVSANNSALGHVDSCDKDCSIQNF